MVAGPLKARYRWLNLINGGAQASLRDESRERSPVRALKGPATIASSLRDGIPYFAVRRKTNRLDLYRQRQRRWCRTRLQQVGAQTGAQVVAFTAGACTGAWSGLVAGWATGGLMSEGEASDSGATGGRAAGWAEATDAKASTAPTTNKPSQLRSMRFLQLVIVSAGYIAQFIHFYARTETGIAKIVE